MVYFRIACIALVLISASHLAGHFFLVPHLQLTNNISGKLPANGKEEEILKLMNEYHKEVGGRPLSFIDIQNGLSLAYALFFFWIGTVLLLIGKGLTRNKRMLSHISLFNAAMLLIGVVISFKYFFWLPALSFAVTMIFFGLAAFKLQREF